MLAEILSIILLVRVPHGESSHSPYSHPETLHLAPESRGSWNEPSTGLPDGEVPRPAMIFHVLFLDVPWAFHVPSGYDYHSHGKSPFTWRFIAGKIICKWAMFHGYAK